MRAVARSWGAAGLVLAWSLAGCATPSQEEYDAAIAHFRALAPDAKAYACADDWYAVRYGVEGFVLVEECAAGTTAEATQSQPLSAEFEQAEVAFARDYYAENPPDSGLMRRVDADLLCEQSDGEIRAGIEQWRQDTEFPTWDGVEYVPSTELEQERLAIWRAVACPVLQD